MGRACIGQTNDCNIIINYYYVSLTICVRYNIIFKHRTTVKSDFEKINKIRLLSLEVFEVSIWNSNELMIYYRYVILYDIIRVYKK